jgi:hypothetical protein
VGHANRPWLHNALGLDAQSWRLCLSFARRCESDADTNGVGKCYTYCYSDGDGNRYGNTFGNANPHLPGNL